MSGDAPYDRGPAEPWDPADLAGELALGTLEGEDLVHALTLYQQDPAFATEVDRWRERLVGLAEAVPEQRPPRDLWGAITARIAADPVRRPRKAAARQWFGVGFWRGWALTATAGLAAFTLVVWQADLLFEPSRRLVVILEDAQAPGRAPWLLAIEPSTHAVTPVAFGSAAVPEGRVQELWVIPPGGAPHSLGLIEDTKTVHIPGPIADPGSQFAVSLEPPGGSPTGAPTGPVIYSGSIKNFPM